MAKTLKIGYLIADDMEVKPVIDFMMKNGATVNTVLKRPYYTLNKEVGDRKLELIVNYCGIGKVNAASAATVLAEMGVDIIVSSGFSGGMADAHGCKAVLGDRFVEHDFDMTVLGYKPSEKPGQELYVFEGDKQLNRIYTNSVGKTLIGTMVTGDCFISSEEKKNFCVDTYGAVACDMETAAIASVAYYANIRFIAIRFVSDMADESAKESYREVNESDATTAFVEVAEWVLGLTDIDELW